MEINFGKIELENLINVVANVKKSEIEQNFKYCNIHATTVVCGDNEVNNVSFLVRYDMNDKIIHMTVENLTWPIVRCARIVWENNDISIDDLTKLLAEKIAVIDKDKDGLFGFEYLYEIIGLNKMYNKIRKDDISYSEYIEYVKKCINS